jgi:hypothetical protein
MSICTPMLSTSGTLIHLTNDKSNPSSMIVSSISVLAVPRRLSMKTSRRSRERWSPVSENIEGHPSTDNFSKYLPDHRSPPLLFASTKKVSLLTIYCCCGTPWTMNPFIADAFHPLSFISSSPPIIIFPSPFTRGL